MYIPNHFEEKNVGVMQQTIEALSFGTLVTVSDVGIEGNHIPFELNAENGAFGTLLCHVARNNRVWQTVQNATHESLIIFQGPSAYISPSLYPTKQETHEVVPTYNYVVIHAYGSIIVHDDEKWIRGAVGRLTRKFEASRESPWKMSDAPQDFLKGMLQNIVGLEIPLTRLEGKWKLNQNRPEVDQQNVIAHLGGSALQEENKVAQAMQHTRTRSATAAEK
jgi:transcriptional regulator